MPNPESWIGHLGILIIVLEVVSSLCSLEHE